MLGKEEKRGNLWDSYLQGLLVPRDHILMKIKEVVDWDSLEKEAEGCYCKGWGRPGYPIGVMLRILFLEYWANLSDVKVVEEIRYNLLYRAFVGIGIQEDIPDDTSLVVFRKRLGEEIFERIFEKLVEQCREKGLLDGKKKIVDGSKVEANVAIKSSLGLLRQGRRLLIKEVKKIDEERGKELERKYGGEISGIKEEAVVKEEVERSERLLEEVEEIEESKWSEGGKKLKEAFRWVLKGEGGRLLSSFIDLDARWGRTKKEGKFYGYKICGIMDGSGIVTSLEVIGGNEHEGVRLKELLKKEDRKKLEGEELYGDKAYDSVGNRRELKKRGLKAIIPPRYENKQAFRFQYEGKGKRLLCERGKKSIGSFKGKKGRFYYFSEKDCKKCEKKGNCLSPGQRRKVIYVSDKAREIMIEGRIERKDSKFRQGIERKWGEAKVWHRLFRARYWGKGKVFIQVLITFLVINAKKMVRLMEKRIKKKEVMATA